MLPHLRLDMLATLCFELVLFPVAFDALLLIENLLEVLIVDFLLYIDDSSRPCLEAPTFYVPLFACLWNIEGFI